jgi:hypothetical protein
MPWCDGQSWHQQQHTCRRRESYLPIHTFIVVLVQGNALQELQKRFDQQEHALAAATATAAAANGSEGVQVEPYFAEGKVQQELSMLHKVESQIEAVARSIDEASKALPNLTQEQQLAQVRTRMQHCLAVTRTSCDMPWLHGDVAHNDAMCKITMCEQQPLR